MSVEHSLYKAIKLCGSKQVNLAQAIGESPDKIRYWLNSGKRVPFHNAIAIEAATDGQVSRFDVAPYARFNRRINTISGNDAQAKPTPAISERVALGVAFEKSLFRDTQHTQSSKNFYAMNGRTDVLAAKHSGFKNHVTYRQAKKVVTQGIYQLVQAMDQESIAISSAALIASLTTTEQEHILQQDQQQIAVSIKQLRAFKTSSSATHDARLKKAEHQYQLPLRIVLLGLQTYCSTKNQFIWDAEQLKKHLLPYTTVDFHSILNALEANGFIRKVIHNKTLHGQIIRPRTTKEIKSQGANHGTL